MISDPIRNPEISTPTGTNHIHRPALLALIAALLLWCSPAWGDGVTVQGLLDLYNSGDRSSFCSEVNGWLDLNGADPRYAELLLLSAECSNQALGRMAIYRQVWERDPDGEQGRTAALKISELSYLLGDYSMALEAGLFLIRKHAESTQARQARFIVVDSYMARNADEQAIALLREFIAGADAGTPGLERAKLKLAGIQLERDHAEEALRLCKEVIASEEIELMPDALLLAGRSHLKLGETGAATRMFHSVTAFEGSPQAEQAGLLLKEALPPPPPPPPPSNVLFAISIGPFMDREAADSAESDLEKLGYASKVVIADGVLHVQVGEFKAEVDAFLAMRRIERELGLGGKMQRIR